MSRSVPVIEKTRQRFPQDDRLLFAIANLELKQGRVESSIQLLRQVTELNSSHYLAWNNLAALLAENPESTAEALHCIQSAIDVVGFGMPTLLDTKAVVLLRQGRNDEAAALLEQITSALLVEDPRYFFHFALAAKRLHRVHDAVQALQQADELQLSGAFLTGIERAELADMRDQIASEQPGEEQ
jgi:tetratricopeptide (TPR) repeat protein